MKKIARIIIGCLVIGVILVYLNYNKADVLVEEGKTSLSDTEENNKIIAEDTKINIAVVGDIMCHNTQFKDAYNKSTDSYDFSYVFDDIKEYLSEPDLTIGNHHN